MRGCREKLSERGRWPWTRIDPGSNGSPRPVKIPEQDETTKKLARFDKLVGDLSPERKVALLERLTVLNQ